MKVGDLKVGDLVTYTSGGYWRANTGIVERIMPAGGLSIRPVRRGSPDKQAPLKVVRPGGRTQHYRGVSKLSADEIEQLADDREWAKLEYLYCPDSQMNWHADHVRLNNAEIIGINIKPIIAELVIAKKLLARAAERQNRKRR